MEALSMSKGEMWKRGAGYGAWGTVVSSPDDGIWGGAPAANEFWCIFVFKKCIWCLVI